MKHLYVRLIFSLLLSIVSCRLVAQGFDPSTAIDIPSSVGHGTGIEHIDLLSGAVVVNIPLLHLKGRGLDTDIVASYDSKVWSSNYYVDPYNGWILTEEFGQGSASGTGWSIGIPGMVAVTTGGMACDSSDCSGYDIILEQIHYYDGSTVSIGSQLGYGNASGPLFSYDGSYVKLSSAGLPIMADGTRILGSSYQDGSGHWVSVQTVEDTNGNQISCPYSSLDGIVVLGTCTDTLGRSITFTSGVPSGGAYPIQTGLSYVDSNGNHQTITFNYSSTGAVYPWIDGNDLCSADQTFYCVWNSGGGYFLTSIALPDGTSYQFSYAANGDGTSSGELSKITLPTGGYISYDYATQAPSGSEVYMASSRVVSHRYISPDGTSGSEQVWTYSIPGNGPATVTDPQNNVHSEAFSQWTIGPNALNGEGFPPLGPVPAPVQSRDLDSSGALLQEIDKLWGYDTNPAYSIQQSTFPENPQVSQITTTLGGSAQQAVKTFAYSDYGNVSQENDYDWAPSGQAGALLRSISTTYLADANPAYAADSVHILKKPATVSISGLCGATSSGTCSATSYIYDGYSSGRLAAGLTGTSSVVGHDYQNFSTATTLRGNVTQKISGPGLNGGSATTDMAYNDLGDVVANMDNNGNITRFTYTDNYSGTQPSGPTLAFVTTVTKPSTGAFSHVERSQYYLNSGLIAAHCGENFPSAASCITGLGAPQPDYAWLSYDLLNRPTGVSFGDGGHTGLVYTDQALGTSITENKAMTASENMVITASYDGLGREYRSSSSDPQGPVYVDKTYDSLGRVQSVSNPYRSPAAPGDPPTGTTGYAYDGLGRRTLVCNPDNGNIVPCSAGSSYQQTAYSGNVTTSYDEFRHAWQRTSDASGNLVKVVEPGGQQTNYGYDALDNLITVNQLGGSGDSPRTPRGYSYDSLSRLLTAFNPETGTLTYNYLNTGGNPCSGDQSLPCRKTDARGSSTTSYSYDALNRLTQKSYSDGVTPTLLFVQDVASINFYGYRFTASNVLGRLSVICTHFPTACVSESSYSYDAMGRINQVVTNTPSSVTTAAAYTISVQYDFVGNIKDLVYPDQLHIQQAWDDAGRLCNVVANTGGPITCATNASYVYLSQTTYAPQGPLTSATLGNGLTETSSFNNRLQPIEIAVSTPTGSRYMYKKYCYGPATTVCQSYQASNNGNIYAVINVVNSNRSQYYQYDALNRISQFYNGNNSMMQTFSTDGFGNMSVTGGTLSSNLLFDSNNRVLSYGYDAAGNVTQVPIPGGGTQQYNYDGEGQLVSLGNPSTPSATYTYDADGTRIRKDTSGAWMEYIYFNGVPMEERSSSGQWSDYVFANGQRLARLDSTHTFDIRFTNDSCSGCSGTPVGGGDRNLYINSVSVGGSVIQQSDPAISFAGAPCNGYNSGVSTLLCNGDMLDSSTPSGVPVAISAYGSQDYFVNPHMQVFINGELSSEWDVPTGTQIYNAYPNYYYSNDHLGTTNVITNAQGELLNDSDYYPFGAENQILLGDANRYKFTGKEGDSESGLDYFGARYYSSSMGRFMSPDSGAEPEMGVPVPFADLHDPQSLNLYGYVGNNPLSRTDPDGNNYRVCVNNGNGGQNCVDLSDDQYHQLYKQQNGKQGITLPTFGNTAITCGGSNCGSVKYYEKPLGDASAGQLAGIALGMGIGKAVGAIWGAIVGRGASEAVTTVAGEVVEGASGTGGKVLLQTGTKQEAKAIIEAMADGAQKASVKRGVAALGNNYSVTISQEADGSITIAGTRPGFDGSMTMVKTIDTAGNSTSTQLAHDAEGNLTHVDPKH